MNGNGKKVLIIDDSRELADCYCEILSDLGYETVWISSAERALLTIDEHFPLSLILVDYEFPQMSGIEFVHKLKGKFPTLGDKTPVVIFSSFCSASSIAQSVRDAGIIFLEKPMDLSDFEEFVNRLIA